MYERKIPVDLDCPLRLTMSLIDSKWKSCILDELRHRALRPSELHKLFPEATPRVLDMQLKELVEDGLVAKTIFPELPPRSEYAITPLGMTLIPIIDAMIGWGEKNAELFLPGLVYGCFDLAPYLPRISSDRHRTRCGGAPGEQRRKHSPTIGGVRYR